MAYRYRPSEHVTAGTRRIAREQTTHALKFLTSDAPIDDQVHRVRVTVKRLRALLRLTRPVMSSPGDYQYFNSELRRISKSLSAHRDAVVAMNTLKRLIENPHDDAMHDSVNRLTPLLAQQFPQTQDKHILLEKAALTLEAFHSDVRTLSFQSTSLVDLQEGYQSTYSEARTHFKKAKKKQSIKAFHTWRKFLKYHYLQTLLIERIIDDNITERREKTSALEHGLGEYHDLFVLRDQLTEQAQTDKNSDLISLALEHLSETAKRQRRELLAAGNTLLKQKKVLRT